MLLVDWDCLSEIANTDDSRRRLYKRANLGYRDSNLVQNISGENSANLRDQVAKEWNLTQTCRGPRPFNHRSRHLLQNREDGEMVWAAWRNLGYEKDWSSAHSNSMALNGGRRTNSVTNWRRTNHFPWWYSARRLRRECHRWPKPFRRGFQGLWTALNLPEKPHESRGHHARRLETRTAQKV